MTQAELEALLAEIAPNGQVERLTFVEDTEERRITRPKPGAGKYDAEQTETVTVRVPILVWYDAGTGMTLRVERNPDNTYTKLSQGPDPKMQGAPATKPPEPQQPATATATEPLKGHPGWKVGKRKVADGSGNTVEETFYVDPQGTETHIPPPEKGATGTTATATEPLKDAPGWRIGQRTVVDANGNSVKETYYLDPQGQVTYTPPPTADGKPKYTQVKFDEDARKWWGLKPTGEWEEMTGGPGAQPAGPRPVGPKLPEIIVGQSQAALRGYKDQLQAEVASGRQTQGWADARWNEAKEIAQFSITEAQLEQRAYESSLNANINLATTKLNHETSGIKTALEFALAINGKLPQGSNLGGQAFAALLGMNTIAAARSGIYDIPLPRMNQPSLGAGGRGAQDSAPPRLTNPGNPQALEAQRAEVQAQLQQEVAPPPAPAAPGAPSAAGGAPYTPPAAPGPAGMTPTAVPAGAPAGAPPVDPMMRDPVLRQRPDGGLFWTERQQSPDAPQRPMVFDPQAAGAVPPAPAPSAAPPPVPVAPALPPAPVPGPDAGAPYNPAQASPLTVPAGAPANPAPGAPNHNPNVPVGRQAPPMEEFAALAAYQPQPMMTPPAAPPMQQPMTQEEPLALLQAQAASKPLWRMTEEEFNRYKAAGVPDDVLLSVPGMAVA